MGRGRGRRVARKLKLQITGGQANPAPPVGPALGQAQVNIGEFVRQFNEATRDQMGQVVPVEITVYEDRSFTFITKTPPAAFLLKQAAGLEKGSGEPNREKVGTVSRAQVEEIARTKMPDLNAADLDGAASLPGLWAAGETACNGVHGANRLASNSLLDGAMTSPAPRPASARCTAEPRKPEPPVTRTRWSGQKDVMASRLGDRVPSSPNGRARPTRSCVAHPGIWGLSYARTRTTGFGWR